jgi:DNA-binding beta-propeller fold protein YncE
MRGSRRAPGVMWQLLEQCARRGGRPFTALAVLACAAAFGGGSLAFAMDGSGSALGGGSDVAPSGSSGLESSLGLGDPIGLPPTSGEASHLHGLSPKSPVGVSSAALARLRLTHLGAAQAAHLDREVFPGQLAQPAGGLPSLPHGQQIVRLLSTHAAQIALGHGRRGAIESTQPMALETSPHHLAPVDLALRRVGGAFESARPMVGVLIPSHAREGVQLPDAGVSLTPVGANGGSLGGSEGQVDGASVLYANTQTDTDTVVKPTTMGVAIDAILRSADSPRQLDYRVQMPSGARLVQGGRGAPVRVVSGGVTLGLVIAPIAVDATGASVPVTMSVEGGILSVRVQGASSDYRYPVSVDPEYVTGEDRSLTGAVFPVESYKGGTNWVPFHTAAFEVAHTYRASYGCGVENYWCEQSWYIEPTREYNGGEYAGLQYKTEGESTVYNLEMWVEGENEPSQTVTEVEYNYGPNGEGRDNHVLLSGGEHQTRYTYAPLSVTSGYLSNPLETPRNNDVRFMDYATKHETLYGFWAYITDARVFVAQEESKHPETEPTSVCQQCGFNTSSPTIAEAAGRTNVLYGTGSWLSPTQGAYEVTAHDPGIGVSYVALFGGGMSEQRFLQEKLGKCLGIQCPETYKTSMTYLPTMGEGEDSIELLAKDAAGLYGDSHHTIKVDAKGPEKLEVTGWPERREISAAPHTLTLSARDEGPSGAKSSGVKSIAVSIDGGSEAILSGASCAEGPCTAGGTYVLHAEGLSEGVHRLVETATDNAGNVGKGREFTFDVRHARPVALGPGAVDPTTGQFTLGATDVSLGGVAAVGRTYQSRNLTAGSYGPLGPQWAVNLGDSESLVTLPEGEVALTASNGGRTTFAPLGKGEYESPLGDENIKVEAKEEAGKGISEYLIKDTTAGTTTVFTQPVGTEDTAPIYANQFGAGSLQLHTPESVAVDPSGNVWVVDVNNDRVLKFSAAGTLLGSYGTEGSHTGEFIDPWGIAINQSTGNVYVTDQGNNRVDELSPSGNFIAMFGWGVQDGLPQPETCSSECQAGIPGSGAGQFSSIAGIAVDPSGHLWVADFGNNRIQELSETGAFLQTFGSEGTGGGQFKGPTNIALLGEALYVTDYNNARVQELSTTTGGGFIEAIGWGVRTGEEKLQVCTSGCRAGNVGSGNGQFNLPRGIAAEPGTGNLYVSDQGNDRVQELSAAGSFISKFGSAGSGAGQFTSPGGVAISAADAIYVVDREDNRVQEWMRPTWLPARTEDAALKQVSTAYAYKPVEVEGKVEIEPTEVLAATPAGITCVGAKGEVEERFLKDGCRALTFNYAETTTAKGQAPSEWGDYKGNLTRVYFHGFDPVSKAMLTKKVAHYLYDAKGRLRAEWDPRTEPKPESEECAKEPLAKGCLATVYGYDEAGHVTSVTPPAQESWGLVYGTISGDSETGRLLKVKRALASAELWKGAAPVNTEAPKLSGTPAVGVRMAVSNGTWSNSPVVYGYQWEDCNSSGLECTPILGATNQNYTPVSSDVGHKLVAQVTAINGGGSVVALSAASAVVAAQAGFYTQTVDSGYSVNAVSCISGGTTCVVSDSAGKALYGTNVSSTSAASWSSWSGPGTSPSEAVACQSSTLCLLAAGKVEGNGGNLYYATSLGGSWTLAYSPAYGVDAISCVSSSFCADGQDGAGSFRWSTSPASTSWNQQAQGTAAMKAISCLSASFCAIADSKGSVHIATTESKVKSSEWKETSVDGSTALTGIACMSSSSCVATDSTGNALVLKVESTGAASATKHDIDGTTSLTGVACPSSTSCVAVDTAGHVLLSKNGGETWSTLYSLGDDLTSVSCASSSLCATADTTGKVTAFNLTGTAPEGEAHSPQAGTTIEYHLPVSGGGGLQNLSKEEVEKWGQKNDYPAEGTAIFAPDEPQGWPASKYTRASIDYMDEEGRTVTPSRQAAAYQPLNTTKPMRSRARFLQTIESPRWPQAASRSPKKNANRRK